MSKKFKLSSSLFGHSLDVRSVAVSANNSIISGSRDKTAKLWIPNKIDPGYTPIQSYRDHKNFVIAVLYLEPTNEYPDGLVITGSNDNTIYIYKPSEPFASFTLTEHSNAVSCLSKCLSPGSFLSGSWDCLAKLWFLGKSGSVVTFLGHSAALWAVMQLADTRIVTASADKTIGMWNCEGVRLKVLNGHNDCVRGLIDLPDLQQFISVANDATIRIWSYSCEPIDIYYGHTNYIYSIARCESGGQHSFVTSDEDRTVRFWQNGENVESFQLPAQSVWSVACLSNGDIVTGSSDGIVRVFTQDESRYADQATLNKFNEEVEALTKQSTQEIAGYKISDLPGKEALYEPGRKPGQMKMIREGGGGVVAYTWVEDGDKSHWEKVGDVLGSTDKTNQDKTMFEGKAYDFVFTVDVEDGKPPLKLPYNRNDDPYQAANTFLAKNALPSSYLEQVVDFILKNTQEQYVPSTTEYVDPFTGGARYTPGSGTSSQGFAGANLDPFTGGSSYSTSKNQPAKPTASSTTLTSQGIKFFPINTYRTFDMGDANVILIKLKEFNEKTGDCNEISVTEPFLEEVVKLCNGPPDDPTAFDTLFKLLDWPDEIVFPVIDVMRMAVRHKKNNDVISTANNGGLLQKLLGFVDENCKIVNNVIVALRTLSNLFIHECGEELVFQHRFDLVENVTALGALNKNGQIALATLLLNLSVATLKRQDELGISVLADVIPDILTKLNDPESQFRGYVALGTLITATNSLQTAEVKTKIKRNSGFVSALQSHLLSGQNDVEEKRRNCAIQVQDILNISF